MRYYIIPNNEIVDEIEAADAGEAIIDFATKMDLDMNIYFRAVTEEEYEEIEREKLRKARKQIHVNFYVDELYDRFDVPEEDIESIAERAYECYRESGSPGYGWDNGLTEYDALEMAVKEYLKGRSNDEE